MLSFLKTIRNVANSYSVSISMILLLLVHDVTKRTLTAFAYKKIYICDLIFSIEFFLLLLFIN
jgi:hypothetical protein